MQLPKILPKNMVGERRFELPASWSRTKRATKLRYSPIIHERYVPACGRQAKRLAFLIQCNKIQNLLLNVQPFTVKNINPLNFKQIYGL